MTEIIGGLWLSTTVRLPHSHASKHRPSTYGNLTA